MNNNNKDINKFFDTLMSPEIHIDMASDKDKSIIGWSNTFGGLIDYTRSTELTTLTGSTNITGSTTLTGITTLTGALNITDGSTLSCNNTTISEEYTQQLIKDVKKQVLEEITKALQVPSHMLTGEK